MDLTSKKNIKDLLKKYRLCPSKRLGQNFLIDKRVIRKIIETADLKPEDTVLEIGPGIGTLTQELAKRVKKMIAVEKDPRMIEILKETLKDFENVKIVKADIRNWKLESSPTGSKQKNYIIVGNLPFYLTAPVIRHFLELPETRPREMVLVVQKEVGQRICAKPPRMNLLAVSVQFYAQPKIISYISKKSFWPRPEVDATIIKITPLKLTRNVLDTLFFRIVRAGFSQPRKQILNNLANKLKLNKEEVKSRLLKNNVQPTQRAETLSIEDWLKLTKSFNSKYGC